MVKKRWYPGLALLATLVAFSVIALGAFTRLIDAGLGCPDWPGCYGHLAPMMGLKGSQLASSTPFVAYKAWAEMVHRYFAACLSFLSFLLIIMGFLKPWRNPRTIGLSCLLFILIGYQIILGLWTVTLKLWPVIVTQHLIGGFFILTTLWLMYLNHHEKIYETRANYPFRTTVFIALVGSILLFLQIVLGAWTSTNYAALSCPGFPFCRDLPTLSLHLHTIFAMGMPGLNYDGGALPENVRQSIHMLHRLGALIVTVYLVFFVSFVQFRLRAIVPLIKGAYIILALLCIQLCLGMINVVFKLPLMTAVLHNLVASLLLLSMITFIYQLFWVRQRPFA